MINPEEVYMDKRLWQQKAEVFISAASIGVAMIAEVAALNNCVNPSGTEADIVLGPIAVGVYAALSIGMSAILGNRLKAVSQTSHALREILR